MNVQSIVKECSRQSFPDKEIVTEPYNLPDAPITGEHYLAGVIAPYMVRSFQQLAMPVGF